MALIEEKQSLTEIYNNLKSNSIASAYNASQYGLYKAKRGTKSFPNKETDSMFKTRELAVRVAGYQMYYYIYLNMYKELIKRKLIKEEIRANQLSGGSMSLITGSITSIEFIEVFAQEFNKCIEDKGLTELLRKAYGDSIILGYMRTIVKGNTASLGAQIKINNKLGLFERADNGYRYEWDAVKNRIYSYVDTYIRDIYATKDENYMSMRVLGN